MPERALERHAELVEASLPLRLDSFNEAVEMLRQAQHDQNLNSPTRSKDLYPNFDVESIERMIDEATLETRSKSLDKLYNKIETFRKDAEKNGESYKFSYHETIRELNERYDKDIKRYRYGKTVLGVLISKLESGFGRIDLLKQTDKIHIPELRSIIS